MRRAALPLALAFALAPSVALAQSAQDKADAEVLFNAGKAALAAGNLAEACPKFAASQNKDPAIGTALYLAECYERSGKIASAWAQFHQAEDMATQRRDSRAALAKARADRLAPSHLTIALAPGARDVSGLSVKRDGEDVGDALFGLAAPIDGGHHVIVATAPGHRAFKWEGDVPAQHGATTVSIPKLAEEGAPVATAPTTTTAPPPVATVTTTVPPPAHEGGGLSGGKIAGIAVGAFGLVAIGASAIMGAVAQSSYQSVLVANGGSCTESGGMNALCTKQSDADTANAAKTLADVGTGVFIGGCVLAVAGIVTFFVAPKSHARDAALTFTPMIGAQGGGAILSGRF